MFSATVKFERLISGHKKLAAQARKIVAQAEAEEKEAERVLTEHLRRINIISRTKNDAAKFAEKIESWLS